MRQQILVLAFLFTSFALTASQSQRSRAGRELGNGKTAEETSEMLLEKAKNWIGRIQAYTQDYTTLPNLPVRINPIFVHVSLAQTRTCPSASTELSLTANNSSTWLSASGNSRMDRRIRQEAASEGCPNPSGSPAGGRRRRGPRRASAQSIHRSGCG